MHARARGRKDERVYRRRRLVAATVLVVVFVVLLMGTALGAAHLTSGSGTCRRCHEMQSYYESWQRSAHKSLECAQCHIPSGTVGLLRAKIGALREVYVHFAGDGAMPLQVNSNVPRATCLSCHPKPTDATYASSSFAHDAHTSGACSECHRGLFHPTAPPNKPVPAVGQVGHHGQLPDLSRRHHRLQDLQHLPHGTSQGLRRVRRLPHAEELDSGRRSQRFGARRAMSHLPPEAQGCRPRQLHVQPLIPQGRGLRRLSRQATPPRQEGLQQGEHGILPGLSRRHESSEEVQHLPHGTAQGLRELRPVSHREELVPGLGRGGRQAGLRPPLGAGWSPRHRKCAGCHKTFGTAEAAAAIPVPTTCVGCHDDRHNGLTDCARCHKTSGWTPSAFSHPGVSGMNWRGMACSDCHPNGYATYTCTTCHGSNGPGD